MHLYLKLVSGEEIEQTIASSVCTIGRSSKCDVVVAHEGMSRIHCRIEVINGEFYVTDLESTNGVLIDGHKIEPNKQVRYATYLPLAFGAVLSLQAQLDDATDSKKRPTNLTPSQSSSGNLTSMTKTKTMSEALKSGQMAAKPNTEKKGSSIGIILNLIVALFIVLAAWWYTENGQEETEEGSSEDYPTARESDQF